MISLKNTSTLLRTYNLPHEVYCAGDDCACTHTTLRLAAQTPTGKPGVREVPRRISGSLRFLGGQVHRGLRDSVKRCPEIKAALDRGDLREVQ